MGFLAQLGTTLKKNFTLKKRQPIIVAFEITWPLIVFLIILGLRQQTKPISKPDCAYRSHSMTSAGMIPFLQSFVCNMNSECINVTEDTVLPNYANAQIGPLMSSSQKLMENETVITMMETFPESIKLVNIILNSLQTPDVRKLIVDGIKIEDLLTNADEFEDYLTNKLGIFPENVTKLILQTTISVNKLLDLIGYTDLKGVACNPKELNKYLKVNKDSNLTLISEALCNINSSTISSIVDEVQKYLTISKLLQKLINFLDILGDDLFSNAVKDVVNLVVIGLNITKSEELMNKVAYFREVTDWIPGVLKIVKTLKSSTIDFTIFEKISHDLQYLADQTSSLPPVQKALNRTIAVLSLLSNNLHNKSDLNIKFIKLFVNTTFISHVLNDILEIPPVIVHNILNSTINLEKIGNFLEKPSIKNIEFLFCEQPGISQLLQNGYGEVLQKKLCSNDMFSLHEISDLLNVKLFERNTIFTWPEIVNLTLEAIHIFNEGGLKSFDYSFQLEPIINSISGLIEVVIHNNFSHVIEIFGPLLSELDTTLSKTFGSSYDKVIQILNISFDIIKQWKDYVFKERYNNFKVILGKYPDIVHDIISWDSSVIEYLLQPFSDPQKIKLIMNDVKNGQLYCTEDNIIKIAGQKPSSFDWKLITSKLCSQRFHTLVQILLKDFYTISSKFDQLQNILQSRPSSEEYNLLKFLVKVQNFVYNINDSETWLNDGKKMLENVSKSDQNKLRQLNTIFINYLAKTPSALEFFVFDKMGQIIEQKIFWRYIHPTLRSMYSVITEITPWYEHFMDFFVESSKRNGLLEKIIHVLATLPQIISLTMDNTIKVLKLATITDWQHTICTPEIFENYFVIPADKKIRNS